MYTVALAQVNTNVAVTPVIGSDLSVRLVNYLTTQYKAKCLEDPFNVCIVPNQTVFSLASDATLTSLATSSKTLSSQKTIPVYVPVHVEPSPSARSSESVEEATNNNTMLTDEELEELSQELDKTVSRTKTYYKNVVDDFQVGDRVIYRGSNYLVIESDENKNIVIENVDMLGYGVNPRTTIKIALANNGMTGKHKKWFWTSATYDPKVSGSIPKGTLKRGILLYDDGPQITSLDSIYLKYTTLPPSKWNTATPEVGMLVSVQSHYHFYTYVVTDIRSKTMDLTLVQDTPSNNFHIAPPSELTVKRSGAKWQSDKLGEVNIYVGSWRNEYFEPR